MKELKEKKQNKKQLLKRIEELENNEKNPKTIYIQQSGINHVLQTLGVMAAVYGIGGGFNKE